jgi:signal transduction histidine kinase
MHTTVVGARVPPLVAGWQRVMPWLGLAAAAMVVLAVTRPPSFRVDDLGGAWAAEVDGRPASMTLPGLFAWQGLPAEGRVRLRRPVTVTDPESAVYLEAPLYAVTVIFDGRVVGGGGDPSSASEADRSVRSVVVELPPVEPGSIHELALDVRGDFGKGGVTGAVALGRADVIRAMAARIELQRLTVVLGLALMGAVPLLVALRHRRAASVAYGTFVTTAALALLARTNVAAEWLPDPTGPIRLVNVAGFLCVGLGVLYADSYADGRPGRAATTTATGALAAALFATVAPAGWSAALELGMQGMTAVFAAWLTVRTYQAWRTALPGSWALVLGLVFVLWGVVSEVTLVQGLRTGSSVLVPASVGFTVALGAALGLREAGLSDQHERLVRSSLDAMVTVDAAGRIENANPVAVELLAPAAAGLPAGTTVLAVVSELHRPLVRAHLGRATQRPDRCEFSTKKGRALESLATPMGNGLVMLTLRDITLRREMDRAVLQAARLETAGVLMGGIAHDFNNMLGSVLAHVGLLRMQVPDERVRQRLDKMEATVERASELTRRLITVARGTGSELAAVQLAAVCQGAVDLTEPTLPPGVELETDLPPDLPLVLGAAGDLEQVLVNLLMNARDAVGASGHLRLAARPLLRGGGGGGDGRGRRPGRARRRPRADLRAVSHRQGPRHGAWGWRWRGRSSAITTAGCGSRTGRAAGPGSSARVRHADAVDEAPAQLPEGRRVVVVEDEPLLLEAEVGAAPGRGVRRHRVLAVGGGAGVARAGGAGPAGDRPADGGRGRRTARGGVPGEAPVDADPGGDRAAAQRRACRGSSRAPGRRWSSRCARPGWWRRSATSAAGRSAWPAVRTTSPP